MALVTVGFLARVCHGAALQPDDSAKQAADPGEHASAADERIASPCQTFVKGAAIAKGRRNTLRMSLSASCGRRRRCAAVTLGWAVRARHPRRASAMAVPGTA